MGKLPNGRTDDAFIDAFYQEVRELERMWQVDVKVEICCSERRGVLIFLLTAEERNTGSSFAGTIARYQVDYPGSTARTLPASLYQAACKLDLLVQGYRAQQGERRASLRG